jgi:hypothetical protein
MAGLKVEAGTRLQEGRGTWTMPTQLLCWGCCLPKVGFPLVRSQTAPACGEEGVGVCTTLLWDASHQLIAKKKWTGASGGFSGLSGECTRCCSYPERCARPPQGGLSLPLLTPTVIITGLFGLTFSKGPASSFGLTAVMWPALLVPSVNQTQTPFLSYEALFL